MQQTIHESRYKDDVRITKIIQQMSVKAHIRQSRGKAMKQRGTMALRNQTWVKGMRSSFNQDRFSADVPKEAIYAEVILAEVQEFISALFGALLRFY